MLTGILCEKLTVQLIYPSQIKMLGLFLSVLVGTTVVENNINDVVPTETINIQHTWFSSSDERQLMVQKAYDIGGLDFVLMLECENGNRNPSAVWDSWRSHGLCQMNTRWHKLPQEYYTSWEYQIEYCYKKWSTWTKFYGPNRKIKGQTCKNYVKNRFIIS